MNDKIAFEHLIIIITKKNYKIYIITIQHSADIYFCFSFRFYLSKHNGRVINLQPNLGNVELSAIFYPVLSPTAPLSSNGSVPVGLQEDAFPIIAPSRDSSGSFGSQVSHTGGDAATGHISANSHLAIANLNIKKYILQVHFLTFIHELSL